MRFHEAGTHAIFILRKRGVSTLMQVQSHRCFRFYPAAASAGQFFVPMQIATFSCTREQRPASLHRLDGPLRLTAAGQVGCIRPSQGLG